MSRITRSWAAFAALGAGVIHLGVAPDTAIPAAVALVVLGVAEFGWGVGVLATNRYVLVRFASIAAFAPSLAWGGLLFLAVLTKDAGFATALPVLPMAVSSLFTLAHAATLARRSRAAADSRASTSGARPDRPLAYLSGLLAGALAISALTTPALAATGAGVANPHSHHGEPAIPTEVVEHSGH